MTHEESVRWDLQQRVLKGSAVVLKKATEGEVGVVEVKVKVDFETLGKQWVQVTERDLREEVDIFEVVLRRGSRTQLTKEWRSGRMKEVTVTVGDITLTKKVARPIDAIIDLIVHVDGIQF